MTGAGPSRVRVEIVEPDLTKALEWSFDPGVIEIRAGDTVVWHNTGSMQHTVTSDTPGLFDSGPLDPGKTWEWTFDSPGSFAYHCTPHPWMKGVVRVLDATGEAPVGVGGFAAGGEQAAGLPPAETAHDQGDESATAPLGRIADNGSPSSKFGLALVASAALIALTLFLAGVSPPRRPGDSTGRA